MVRHAAPEDLVNAMFTEPDPKMFSDKGLRVATARLGVPLSDEAKEKIRSGVAQAKAEGRVSKYTWTDAQREAQAARKRGVKRGERSAEHRANSSKALTGRVFTEEHKAKIAAAAKARIANAPRILCPHCGLIEPEPIFRRHHGDRCKRKRT